jgi:DNA-binding transcriptional MocR family regulator
MAKLSERVRDLRSSPVRAMLETALRPEVISFAGGLPAPDTFTGLDLPKPPPDLLQYGPTEGEPALRERLAIELGALGLDCPAERVMVLSGSQQGIDLAAKLFIDAGAPVAVESPAYLAALQVFRLFGAGLQVLDRADPGAGWTERSGPRFAYVTPTFQNPSGHCWTDAERGALAQACDASGVALFEDDPYRDLAYDPCERRPIAARLKRASWIYQGSFSKTLAPGLRLGFLAASEDLFPHLVNLKQAADLHASRVGQWYALRYLEDPARAPRLERLVDRYRRRRDAFAASMDRHLGGLVDWRVPAGGLFFWATTRGGIDASALLERARQRNVLFTPGEHFLVHPQGQSTALRLNFSHAEEARADRGLEILGQLMRETQGEALPAA